MKPDYFMIEPTSACNLDCIPCSRNDMVKDKQLKVGSLDKKHLIKILEKLPPAKHIRFHGMGELFLLPNHLELIETLRERCPDAWIELVTNGQYKNTNEEAISELVNMITFSFDGHNKESYEAIRVGGEYDIIFKNIKRFLKHKVHLELNFVCGAYNQDKMLNMVHMAYELGVGDIRFNIIQDWTGTLDKNVLDYNKKTFLTCMASAQFEAETMGIELTISGNPNFKISECEWMNKRVYITHSGDIMPCCMRTELKYKLGNIFNTSLEEALRKPYDMHSNILCHDCPYVVNRAILREINK